MKLQVKRLDGPNEIRLNKDADTSFDVDAATNDRGGAFTCYLNRQIRGDDPPVLTVTVNIHNMDGSLETTHSLTISRDENINNDCFRFALTLKCPMRLSGSHFHVHAVLLDNADHTDEISCVISSYHMTIKKVYIYAQKRFEQVYWSSSERITYEEEEASQESVRTGNIGQNEDAFLHLKTTGMYNDNIVVILTVNDDREILQSIPMSMKQNRRVVAFDMGEVIQRYRQLTKQDGNVYFSLKAWVAVRNDFPLINNSHDLPWTSSLDLRAEALRVLPPVAGLGPVNRVSPETDKSFLLFGHSEELMVRSIDSTPAVKRTSTGTVYVNVNDGDTEIVEPTRFTDFRIGYVGHLEGVGEINGLYTVYPLSFYEIKVSDLVVCNIITIDEAAYLAPYSSEAGAAETLRDNFNKLTAEISAGNLLLNKFRIINNNNRVNGTVVQKLLSQVRTRNAEESYQVCRDAWQCKSSKGEIYSRTELGRYNTNKECPPGEFFLNWLASGFCVWVSIYADDNSGGVIEDYPDKDITDKNRGEIAIHNGRARASVGCITFDKAWNKEHIGSGWNTKFHEFIYPRPTNASFLNFLCIEERNATQKRDDLVNGRNYWRWYDLVKPNN